MAKDLSVVIPAYNSEKTIFQCINSVVSECEANNLDYEIIIVDDGSTDSTSFIISEICKTNKNIIYIKQENAGPSKARNNGILHSTGNLIAFNDSDDGWTKGRLKYQLDFLSANSDVDLVTSVYGTSTRGNNPFQISYKNMLFHNCYVTQTSVMKTKVAKNVLFPEDMIYSEDMRFVLKIMKYYNCFYLPNTATTCLTGKNTFGEAGLSSNLKKMYKGELSNLYFIHKEGKVPFYLYLVALFYSYAKYLRRILITKRNAKKTS